MSDTDDTTSAPHPRYPAEDLIALCARAFEAVGVPPADAADLGRLLIEADITGFDTHGLFRLSQYIKGIKAGGIDPAAVPAVERETASTGVIDGGNAMGHLVMQAAARLAMEKAAETGIGWVGTRMSNHAGAASVYAAMPLERDMIGLYGAVGATNHMPPWGGTEMLLGTNPIAAAIPALEEPPVVLDFATTVSSFGKVKTAAQRGEEMPVGWMIGPDGEPLTDPNRASDGFLVPIGGHKGYALSLMIGLLAGSLNGAALGEEIVNMGSNPELASNTGQFILAVDVAAFGDVTDFKKRVDGMSRLLRGSPTLPGFDAIRVPGDGRAATLADCRDNGVPVHPALLDDIAALATDLGIEGLR